MVQMRERAEASTRLHLPPVAPAPATDPHDVLVGGSNSAFALPLEGCIDRASGSRIWDEAGNEYVDFLMASGPLILGHAHARVTQAVAQQMTRGSAYHALNRPAVDLAERIVNVPGCVDLVRFASTGTEATMHAVRLARAYTGRDKVLLFRGSYHGSHNLSIVGFRGTALAQSGGVPTGAIEDAVLADFNHVESLEEAFALHGDALAAVLIEPQQRSRDPKPGFLERVAELCRAAGALLIFDEVLTGFRLAYGGAQEYYGVEPDVVCYGKIVGGGLPLSAIGGRREVMSLADPARAGSPGFVHISGTLSGNPVSTAAGLATLHELERPGTYETLHSLGKRLRERMRGELLRLRVQAQVFGSGPIAAVNFPDDGVAGRGKAFRGNVNREMIRRGILAQMKTRLYVSLAHTESEIDGCAAVFGEAVAAALDGESEARTA